MFSLKSLSIFLFFVVLFLFFNRKNKLQIECDNQISLSEVRIYLKSQGDPRSLIWDGKQQQKIPNLYGENDWIINYKDSLQCSIRHFKTRNKARHNYKIKISRRSNEYYCVFQAKGDNELEVEKKLNHYLNK